MIPGNIPTNFVTDNGTAVPQLNILNVNGLSTTDNNNTGIQTVANPSPDVGTNNLAIELTNRIVKIGTVINTTNVPILDLGSVPASYRFRLDMIARVTSNTGAPTTVGDTMGYTIWSTFKTSGGITPAATIIETPFIDADEDLTSITAQINMIATGNEAVLVFTTPANCQIDFTIIGTYIMVS